MKFVNWKLNLIWLIIAIQQALRRRIQLKANLDTSILILFKF